PCSVGRLRVERPLCDNGASWPCRNPPRFRAQASAAATVREKEAKFIMKCVRSLMAARLARRSSRQTVALIAVACLTGCGVRPRASPLDEDLARTSLRTALEAWKKGDSPATLKNGSPSIVAQDPDWVAGTRLVAYELASEDRRVAENLFVPVELTLETK